MEPKRKFKNAAMYKRKAFVQPAAIVNSSGSVAEHEKDEKGLSEQKRAKANLPSTNLTQSQSSKASLGQGILASAHAFYKVLYINQQDFWKKKAKKCYNDGVLDVSTDNQGQLFNQVLYS